MLSRLNKFVRKGVFELMEIEWIDDAKRAGQFQQLKLSDQNEYLDTLYQLSRTDHHCQQVSMRASEVYEVLKMQVCREMQRRNN